MIYRNKKLAVLHLTILFWNQLAAQFQKSSMLSICLNKGNSSLAEDGKQTCAFKISLSQGCIQAYSKLIADTFTYAMLKVNMEL